ncbi:protein of unknown function [Methylocella tundrae]|uniref:Uncharacterized protein n=1 Tax=Methylocella tundrae TaxID=227605 RepID=A0A4U8YZS7_METTU|nr:protein of unknown function [Methylocella tundrae]
MPDGRKNLRSRLYCDKVPSAGLCNSFVVFRESIFQATDGLSDAAGVRNPRFRRQFEVNAGLDWQLRTKHARGSLVIRSFALVSF